MKIFFLSACILLNTVVWATNFDSLRQTLSTQVGMKRFPTLLLLCNNNYRGIISNHEASVFGKELFSLGSKLKDTTALVEACLCLANNQDRSLPQSDARQWLDQSQKLARRKPALLANVLFWKMRYYNELGKIDSAFWVFKQANALTQRHQLISARIRLLSSVAKIYSTIGQFKTADSLSQLAFRFCKTPQDSAIAYTFIGNIKEDEGQLDDAFRSFLKAYQLEKKVGDVVLATFNLQQCAGILRDQGQFQQATTYLGEAVRLAKQTGNISSLAGAYHTLGEVYNRLKVYDKALYFYKSSLALKKDVGRPQKVLNTINAIAELYNKTEKYDSCLMLCKQYLPLSQKIRYSKAEGLLAFRAALAADKSKQSTLAHHYLAMGERVLFKVKPSEDLLDLYGLAANAAATVQDFQKAFRYQAQFQSLQDSIYTSEKNKIISELEARFASKEQQQKIKELEQKNKLQAAYIAQQRYQWLALLLGAFLLAIIALILWRNIQIRNQHNTVLEKINQDLNHKNKEIQTLLREVHHRVKNNLQIISSLLRLQARGVDQEDAAEVLRISQSRVHSIALLHQRLYQGEGLNQVQLSTYLHDLVGSLRDTYRMEEHQIQVQEQIADIKVDVDLATPLGLIANELITNAIKHAFPDQRAGTIEISISSTPTQLSLLIKDNGIGLKLSGGKPLISKSSFGLELVESLADKINASLIFSNVQGTQIELLTPIDSTQEIATHD